MFLEDFGMIEEKEYYYDKKRVEFQLEDEWGNQEKTRVTNKDEMYKIYGIVMEQLQKFEQRL